MGQRSRAKTQLCDGSLINNILITFVPQLVPGRARAGGEGRAVVPLLIFWFICHGGGAWLVLVQPGAVLCYTRKLFEILIERWQQRGQGWLSTIATKFIKNIFCGKSIMRKIIKLARPGCEDSSVLCSAWITRSQCRARGISQERHNILSPPPALQQLMHHNLNNNYVQYNFWWSKLTKTSLYQEIFVPTNKKPWPEFANLASFCKMLWL